MSGVQLVLCPRLVCVICPLGVSFFVLFCSSSSKTLGCGVSVVSLLLHFMFCVYELNLSGGLRAAKTKMANEPYKWTILLPEGKLMEVPKHPIMHAHMKGASSSRRTLVFLRTKAFIGIGNVLRRSYLQYVSYPG